MKTVAVRRMTQVNGQIERGNPAISSSRDPGAGTLTWPPGRSILLSGGESRIWNRRVFVTPPRGG